MVVPARVFDMKNDTLTVRRIADFGSLYYAEAAFIQWLVSFVETPLMKKIFALAVFTVLLNSCAPIMVVDSNPKKTPPGQAKKVTGSQSAKPYAPGQQKKH